jgi:salicylate hydroxylase
MCGIALAIMLVRSGIQVDLFESHSKFGEAGASVTLGANAVRAFSLMGILDTICASTGQKPGLNRMLFTANTEQGEETVYCEDGDDSALLDLTLHRVSFIESLIPLLPEKHVHFNKRCIDITHTASSELYQVHFDDGTYHEADLIIGADGIRSVVRKAVVQGVAPFSEESRAEFNPGSRLTEDKNLMFTGCRLYRAIIPYETLKNAGLKQDVNQRVKNRIGKTGNVFTIPIKGGSLINVAAFSDIRSPVGSERVPPLPAPWVVKDVPNSELIRHFQGWDEETNIILRNMGTSSYWALHSMGPLLDTFVNGKVVLVGDAAHASTPFLGAGIGQGIEDLFMLWRLLTDPRASKKNLQGILKTYDSLRVPRASYVVTASGEVPNVIFPVFTDPSVSKEVKLETIRDFKGRQERIKGHDVEVDAKKAIEALEREGYF